MTTYDDLEDEYGPLIDVAQAASIVGLSLQLSKYSELKGTQKKMPSLKSRVKDRNFNMK